MKIKFVIESFIFEKSIVLRKETCRYINDQIKPLNLYFENNNIYDFNKLKYCDLLNFISQQKSKNISNQTINKRICILKRLIKYSLTLGQKNTKDLIQISQFKKLNSHSNSYNTLNDLQLKNVKLFIKNLSINLYYEFRLKIIISILLSTGIRANELINIKVPNIDLLNRTIYLDYTKTEKTRFVYISKNLINLLALFIKKYDIKNYLICSYNKDPLNIDSLTSIFTRLSNKIGFSISPHVIRHTFATKQLENGVNIEVLRKLLGHTRLTTTQIYLSLNDKYIINEFDKGDILK